MFLPHQFNFLSNPNRAVLAAQRESFRRRPAIRIEADSENARHENALSMGRANNEVSGRSGSLSLDA
jgi:hypothetical protein